MNGLALGEEIGMLLPLRLFLSVRDLVLYLDSNMMATSILGTAVRQSHISNLFLILTKPRLRGQHLNRHCVLTINPSCDGVPTCLRYPGACLVFGLIEASECYERG